MKLAQESPPVQSGKNFVYRQCEHCDYLLASTSGAQAITGEHYCLREGMVTLVRWTP